MVRITTRGGGPDEDAVDVEQYGEDLSGGVATWILTWPGRSTGRGGDRSPSRVHTSIHCHVHGAASGRGSHEWTRHLVE